MARTETNNLKLGMWADGENPGAGTQNQSAIGTGLNDNWKILDNAVGTDHQPNGAHRSAVIDGVHLKPTVADGATIVQDGGTKKLRIPDGGIGPAQLAAGAVTGPALATGAVTEAKIGAGAVSATGLAVNAVGANHLSAECVGTTKIAAGAVTAVKLDPATRIMTGVTLYANVTEAQAGAGQSAPAGTEWQETSTVDVVKMRCLFFKQAGMTTLRLYGKGRTTDPYQPWTVTVQVADFAGSVLASGNCSGANTTYIVYAEASMALDISALAAGAMYEVFVKLRTGGNGATALMKHLQLVVTG